MTEKGKKSVQGETEMPIYMNTEKERVCEREDIWTQQGTGDSD